MNPQNGKGSKPRKNRNDEEYASNWERIFGNDRRKKDHSDNGPSGEQKA